MSCYFVPVPYAKNKCSLTWSCVYTQQDDEVPTLEAYDETEGVYLVNRNTENATKVKCLYYEYQIRYNG